MQISRYTRAWIASLGFVFLCSSALAVEELDLLEAFGLEVFGLDPAQQAAAKKQQREQAIQEMPEHISPETLALDEALDAINLAMPLEPDWQPIEYEISLTGIDSKECCLRAIRSTRYEVERRCTAQNKALWQIESTPLSPSKDTPIATHKLCNVYQNNIEKTTKTQQSNQPKRQPKFYRCTAKSVAKCFDPSGPNALFVHQ